MKRILLAGLAAATLAACGGGETKTETVVQQRTVTVTAPAAPAATPPATGTETETAPATASLEAPEGVPSGTTVPANGTYTAEVRSDDYTGRFITGKDRRPREGEWPITTDCSSGTCVMTVRRQYENGSFKAYELRETSTKGTWAATSSGTVECPGADDAVPVRQRFSLRLTSPEDVEGTQVARTFDAYLRLTGARCEGPTDEASSGVVYWRGAFGVAP